MLIGSYIEGQVRDVSTLGPECVRVEDVADCLSKINRYNGRTPYPYSVAQHAVLVAELCLRDALEAGHSWPDAVMDQYEGLHHDDVEAYTGDISRPYKQKLWVDLGAPPAQDLYTAREFENHLRGRAVAPAFGLAHEEPERVKRMDDLAWRLEERFLRGSGLGGAPCEVLGLTEAALRTDWLRPMHWRRARQAFLDLHLKIMPGAGL